MAGEPQGIERLAPDKLLTGFSRTKVMRYLLIAVAIHVVAVAATSIGYIRDRWIDPEGAARRRAEQLEARKAEEASRLAAPVPRDRQEGPKGVPSAKATGEAPNEARKKSPVMKEITDLPKKGEIPKQPDDLGISIDETNK